MIELELLQNYLQRLNKSKIDYTPFGSIAGNYWSIPRSMHNIAFVDKYSNADVKKIVKLLNN